METNMIDGVVVYGVGGTWFAYEDDWRTARSMPLREEQSNLLLNRCEIKEQVEVELVAVTVEFIDWCNFNGVVPKIIPVSRV